MVNKISHKGRNFYSEYLKLRIIPCLNISQLFIKTSGKRLDKGGTKF